MTENRVHPHSLIELPMRELREAGGISHDEATQQIRGVEQGIRDNPYAFRTLLTALGRAANSGTLRLERPMNPPPGVEPATHRMAWTTFVGG